MQILAVICYFILLYTNIKNTLLFYDNIEYVTRNTPKGGGYMKPLKNKVSITLDEDLIEKIKYYSELDDRSFSQYINIVLKEHIKRKELNQKERE